MIFIYLINKDKQHRQRGNAFSIPKEWPALLYHFYSAQKRVDNGCAFALIRNEGFSMNKVILKDSIELLKRIQVELHDDIESSTRMGLNQVIQQLELYSLQEAEEIKSAEIVNLIGKGLVALPVIAKLLEKLMQQ